MTDGDGRYLTHLTKPGKKSALEEATAEVEEDDQADQVEEVEQDGEDESDDQEVDNVETDDVEKEEKGSEESLTDMQKELEKKPMEVVAAMTVLWIQEHGLEKTLQLIGADSTKPVTGWRAGVIAWIEKKIGRKLHWLICMAHTNELGLRQLIQTLDGKTDSKKGFSGPLGKLLKKVDTMKTNRNFKKISVGPELIELPSEIVKTLSTDANLAYLRCKAVRSGILPRDVELRKTGEIVHSRWLTTGSTFLDMWMKEHGLTGELYDRLETIVIYEVSLYFPMFFLLKVKHSWLEAPRHVLHELELFRLQSPKVQELLLPTLCRGAWNSHSESVLQTMLCSKAREEREFAVDKILQIRGRGEFGDLRPRARKHPQLSLAAEKLQDMINWKGAKEPVLSCSLSIADLKKIKDTAMEVPYYPLHTQGIEKAVQETTDASDAVYGFLRRDRFIRARAENRELMPVFSSKKNLFRLLE